MSISTRTAGGRPRRYWGYNGGANPWRPSCAGVAVLSQARVVKAWQGRGRAQMAKTGGAWEGGVRKVADCALERYRGRWAG